MKAGKDAARSEANAEAEGSKAVQMIVTATVVLFVVLAALVWRERRATDARDAYIVGAIVALLTAVFGGVTGYLAVATAWRFEVIFCGLAMAVAFAVLGIVMG